MRSAIFIYQRVGILYQIDDDLKEPTGKEKPEQVQYYSCCFYLLAVDEDH